MCGIIGYIGNKNAAEIIINGLKRQEYRGYDSAGLALLDQNFFAKKRKGKLIELESTINYEKLKGYKLGIGHTRWATHGQPSERNAHPHFDCQKQIALVHNGIIENYFDLLKLLKQEGHKIKSETDTELIVHLIEYYHTKLSLIEAVNKALLKIEGAYGLAVISLKEPNKIIAARKGSPLILGIGQGESFVASDASAIVEHTRQVIYLEDNEIVEIRAEKFRTYDLGRKRIHKSIETIDWNLSAIEKHGFDHFMLKEIYEQEETIKNAYRGRILKKSGKVRLDGLRLTENEINKINRIIFIACGTSWHAGLIGEYLIEEYARIPVEVEYASEFRYRKPILNKNDLVITISQSGETADTLAALREAKVKGAKVLGITNVVGSTIARESEGGIYTHAGPEVGVASTKAFTSQITVLVLLTILFARRKDMTAEEGKIILNELEKIPNLIKKILADKTIKKIAKNYKDKPNFLYLGRGIHFPVALEGALKLKEISYIHAEGYPAAEMKHGPIALIDENMPVVFIAWQDEIYKKIIANIQEVKARKGAVIIIANEKDKEASKYADHVIYLPKVNKVLSPLLTVIPLQLLSYYIAVERGCHVDQPRNLAKSVTVE